MDCPVAIERRAVQHGARLVIDVNSIVIYAETGPINCTKAQLFVELKLISIPRST